MCPRLNKDEFIFIETIAKICDMKFIIEKSYWEIKTMRLKQELVNIAKELLDKQSLKEDVKASNDIKRIERILNGPILAVELYNEAVLLDRELMERYPEIEDLCNTAKTMRKALGIKGRKSNEKPEDAILQALITDMFGIYASVLLNHQKIDYIKQFIDSVE